MVRHNRSPVLVSQQSDKDTKCKWLITPYCVIQNRAHDCKPILDNTINEGGDSYINAEDMINDLKMKGFSEVYIACPQGVWDDKKSNERYRQQLAAGCFPDLDVVDTSSSSQRPRTDADADAEANAVPNENAMCKHSPTGDQDCEKCKPD